MKTQKRRRKEGKTNYLKRIKLLKSEEPRIVFRRTNRYIIAQIVESKESRDKVKKGITSKILLKYGWPKELEGSLKSLPASYLTGFLIGKEIQKEKSKTPVHDTGIIRIIHGNKFFSFLKGLKDSGIDIKCDEEKFPAEDRIKGKYLKEDFSKKFEEIKSNIEKKWK